MKYRKHEAKEWAREVFRGVCNVILPTFTMESGGGRAAKVDGLDGSDFHELWEVVAGTVSGRKHTKAITLFKSVGTALQDLALARKIYEVALAKGLGRDLGDFPHVKPLTGGSRLKGP